MKNKKPETVKEMGAKGGKALFKKRGKKYMAKIGKRGAKAKWKNKE